MKTINDSPIDSPKSMKALNHVISSVTKHDFKNSVLTAGLTILLLGIGCLISVLFIDKQFTKRPLIKTLPDRGLIVMQKDTVKVLSDNREDTVIIIMDDEGYNIYCTQGYTVKK